MSSIHDAVSKHLGGDHEEKKPKKAIHKIVHEKSTNGDHIFTHKHTHPEHHPDEVHTKRGDDEMVAHMMENAGTPNPGEGQDVNAAPDPNGAAAGAAPAGAPAPMAAAGM